MRSGTLRATAHISNCYGANIGPNMSASRIAYLAKCNLAIGGLWFDYNIRDDVHKTAANIRRIREINPDFRIVDYTSAPDAPTNTKNLPADAWLRNSDGAVVAGWPGSSMLNLANPDVVEWVAQHSIRHVKELGLDGVFLDSLDAEFDAWEIDLFGKKPLNFQSSGHGKFNDFQWLTDTWRKAKLAIAKRVRNLLGSSALLMANQPGKETAPYLNGVLLEDWVDYFFNGKKTFEQLLSDCTWWLSHSRTPAITTLSCSSGLVPPYNAWKLPTGEQSTLLNDGKSKLQRMRFGLAAALMVGANFSFDLNTRWRGQHWWYPEYDVDLGKPVAPYSKRLDGTWQRPFARGLVLANPTSATISVNLSTALRDVSTGKSGSSFNIDANDGMMLVS
jgi:hypothetical protein